MGIVLDSSVLIAAKKRRFHLRRLFEDHPEEHFLMAAISASELLHGVERARPPSRKANRRKAVEHYLETIAIVDFDLAVARQHAAIWAQLEKAGTIIGAHDLIIAATARYLGSKLVTLNEREFKRVPGLRLLKTTPYRLEPPGPDSPAPFA